MYTYKSTAERQSDPSIVVQSGWPTGRHVARHCSGPARVRPGPLGAVPGLARHGHSAVLGQAERPVMQARARHDKRSAR
jgi:hypothetical protein